MYMSTRSGKNENKTRAFFILKNTNIFVTSHINDDILIRLIYVKLSCSLGCYSTVTGFLKILISSFFLLSSNSSMTFPDSVNCAYKFDVILELFSFHSIIFCFNRQAQHIECSSASCMMNP